MATALAQRYKKFGDKRLCELRYILKRKPRDAKMYDLKRISEEIEALGGMSAKCAWARRCWGETCARS